MAEKSAIQRIKELDAERADIFDQAKDEALQKAKLAVAEGRAFSTVGISQLTTSRRHGDQAVRAAESAPVMELCSEATPGLKPRPPKEKAPPTKSGPLQHQEFKTHGTACASEWCRDE